jgi:hypothetical protein
MSLKAEDLTQCEINEEPYNRLFWDPFLITTNQINLPNPVFTYTRTTSDCNGTASPSSVVTSITLPSEGGVPFAQVSSISLSVPGWRVVIPDNLQMSIETWPLSLGFSEAEQNAAGLRIPGVGLRVPFLSCEPLARVATKTQSLVVPEGTGGQIGTHFVNRLETFLNPAIGLVMTKSASSTVQTATLTIRTVE